MTIAPQVRKWVEQRQKSECDHKRQLLAQALEKNFIRVGYAFVGLSVTLFIIAGFIVDLK